MPLVKFKRIKRFNDEPTIAISSDRFSYNSLIVKIAELTKYSFVSYYIDEEERKISFEFLTERNEDSYVLEKKISKGVRSTAIEIIGSYPWIKKISQLKDSSQRSFSVKKEGRLWSIKLRPVFEFKCKREEKDSIKSGTKGIYRYLDDKNEILYIGKGNIKERLGEQTRKDWIFDCVEYSVIEKEEEQFEWENYWLLQYKEGHGGRLPYYNNNSGHAKKDVN